MEKLSEKTAFFIYFSTYLLFGMSLPLFGGVPVGWGGYYLHQIFRLIKLPPRLSATPPKEGKTFT